MKKVLALSALLAVGSTQVFAANDLESAFKESKIMGQFRAFYIDRNYESGTNAAVKVQLLQLVVSLDLKLQLSTV